MKYLISITIAVFSLLSFNAVAASDGYLCTAEQAVGFSDKEGKWDSVEFDVSEEQFILRQLKDSERALYNKTITHGMFVVGSSWITQTCMSGRVESSLYCESDDNRLLFSPISGLYTETRLGDYWVAGELTESPPKVIRGTCTKI
jgi:hypothetical protein